MPYATDSMCLSPAAYWSGFLKFNVDEKSANEALLSCASGNAKLKLVQLPAGEKMNRGTA